MRHAPLVLLLLATMLPASVLAEEPGQRTERFEGIARSRDGKLVYRETHAVELEGDRVRRAVTRYYAPSGKPIARLVTRYGADPYAPAYELFDERGTSIEAAEPTAGGIRLRYQGESGLVPLPGKGERLVLGQGLDQLAKAELEALAAGKELAVRFAIPSRLDSYGFLISRTQPPESGVVKLQIRMDSWLLSLLAPTLEVDYEQGTGRLLTYRGVSNLSGPDGEVQQVVIRYSYPPEPAALGGALLGGAVPVGPN